MFTTLVRICYTGISHFSQKWSKKGEGRLIALEQYRLILVDDEENLRRGIIHRIDWEKHGFAVVGEAENGCNGLELAEQTRPDVVISDIKMPFMDGLEMSRQILKQQPNVKVILLSGFDDFEYAQEAMTLGISEYILKPISADELEAVLDKLHARITEEVQQQRSIERLREHYRRSLPVLREQLLHRMLDRPLEDDPIADMERFEVDMRAGCYAVAYLHADAPAHGLDEPRELVPVSVRELVENRLEKTGFRFQCVIRGDCAVFIVLLDGVGGMSALIDTLDSICTMGERSLGLVLSAGIGLPVTDAKTIYQSTQGAREALGYRALAGAGRAIYIGDIEPNPSARFAFDEKALKRLVDDIKLGKTAQLPADAEALVRCCCAEGMSVQQHRFCVMTILTELGKLMQIYQLDISGFRLEQFLEDASPAALLQQLTALSRQIAVSIGHGRSRSVSQLVENAKEYVAAHYQEPTLSAERVCAHLHVSQSYFSTLFKRETGENFVAHLTRIRLERAVELLRTSDDKAYIIAEKIGLLDPNYFSYIFKKQYGVSPSKYREGMQ